MNKDLLFEIGVEELPAGFIKPALESLVKYLSTCLEQRKLNCSAIETFSSPRRLTVLIKALPERQDDENVERIGPASGIAFNSDGTLSKAGLGFLKSTGITREALETKQTDKGDYLLARIHVEGEATSSILRQILPESIRKISFPKTMYWNSKALTFARPIRWILALYGNEPIEFGLDGIKSGNYTYGNVLQKSPDRIEISKISAYQEMLEKHFVICDREKRKQLIENQINDLVKSVNGKTGDDDALLEEVTDIVEFPTAVLSKFDEKYLILPERVIHSTLAKNQKYFVLYSNDKRDTVQSSDKINADSLVSNKSRMLNYFVFVANNHPDFSANTTPGNERVVKARLDDAVFYYEEDLKKSIDYFNDRLSNMVFHASLGSIKNKVARTEKISLLLADMLKLEQDEKKELIRAVSICKFDLATNMVAEKEFAGLQGYIGMKYATHFGESDTVAQAVEEHYHPLSFNGELPRSVIATIISIADKTDTLCSLFALGNIPTGSNDPYALRRAGNGIIRMLYEKELRIDLKQLVSHCYRLVKEDVVKPQASGDTDDKKSKQVVLLENEEQLLAFLKQRTEWVLEQNKIDYDIINTVMFEGFTEITELKKKVVALQNLRNRDDFEELILSFKRVANIIQASKDSLSIGTNVKTDLLIEESEKALYDSLINLEEKSESLLIDLDYGTLLECFITLKEPIDLFFDNVLVNVDDEALKKNRYALLKRIRSLFVKIGDLSKIVVEGDN